MQANNADNSKPKKPRGFQPGVSGNPNGRPTGIFTGRSWFDIVNQAWEDYTPEELIELSNKISAGEKTGIASKPAMAIVMLGSALQKDGLERERMLDRLLGKAVQRIGGENPGEGIKIATTAPIQLETLGDNELHMLMDTLEKIAASRAIDATTPAQLSHTGADSDTGG